MGTEENKYLAADLKVEADQERLTALEQTWDPTSIRHLKTIGVDLGWKCLNVGAGYGSITSWLAQVVGKTGKVVATDIRTELHRQGIENVEIRQHDITKDNIEKNYYDLVLCRALLQHLSDPEVALLNMLNAVKPGGWILVEEMDNWTLQAADTGNPNAEFFNNYVHEAFAVSKEKGLLDPGYARKLRVLFDGLNLFDIKNEGITHVFRGGESWPMSIQHVGQKTYIKEHKQMGIEENKTNVRRQVEECWNNGDFSSVPELISPDFVYSIPTGELKGHDGFKQWVNIWHTACPDFHMTINEMVGEDHTVVVNLSWTGTFTGKFMDYEPTGNKIDMTEAWFIHFEDEKDTGPTPFANLLSLFQQMGINPTG